MDQTDPDCPKTLPTIKWWPHMNTSKIYKGFRGEARSRKPGQPGQPGSYEEALRLPCYDK